MIHEELLDDTLPQEQKDKNEDAIYALEEFVTSNTMSRSEPYIYLQELAQRHYPITEKIYGYRGTRFETSYLLSLLQDKQFTVKAARAIRSWTSTKSVGMSFAATFKYGAFGVLLEEYITPEEIVIDMSNVIQDLQECVGELNYKEGTDGVTTREKDLNRSIRSILSYAEEENEIMRWVKPRQYVLGEQVKLLYVFDPDALDWQLIEAIQDSILNIRSFPKLYNWNIPPSNHKQMIKFEVSADQQLVYKGGLNDGTL